MCDAAFHADTDARLTRIRPAQLRSFPDLLVAIKDHPYGDECCQVEQGDGCVVWKGDYRWRDGALVRDTPMPTPAVPF